MNNNNLKGMHHVTAITSDAIKIYDFFTDVLGLRLVKKTVNKMISKRIIYSLRMMKGMQEQMSHSSISLEFLKVHMEQMKLHVLHYVYHQMRRLNFGMTV